MHALCASQARARALCASVLHSCRPRHDLPATTLHCKAKRRLSSHFTVPSSNPALRKPHLATLQQLVTHSKLLHTERTFYTQKPEAFAHRSFCTQKLLHRAAFTQRSFYTKKLLHRKAFTHSKFLHREAFRYRSSYTEPFLHMISGFRQQLQLQNRISTPKPKKERF